MSVASFKLEQVGTFFDREDGSRNGVVTYLAHTDDLDTSQADILADPRCPQRFVSGHPQVPTIECRSRRCDTLSDFVYRVTATFDNQRQTKEDSDDATTALIRGSQRAFTVQRPVFFDAFGMPLVNRAGDFYEGLTKRVTLRQFNVTANFASLTAANFLFKFAGTLNASEVTILGETFPGLTCSLGEVSHPDEPMQDNNGVEYWPITYDVSVDPDGHFLILPNRGANELIYQTRSSSSDDWEPARREFSNVAAYDSESDEDLRRIVKARITTESGQDVGSNIWLDERGQSEKVKSFNTTTISGAIAKDSADFFTAQAEAEFIGRLVQIPFAGGWGRTLTTRVESVSQGVSLTLADEAKVAVDPASLRYSGAIVNYAVLDEVADWSAIPLPNNQP